VIIVFVVIVAVLGIGIYLTVVLRAVPGAMDERLGRLEDLPPNLGEWVRDESSPEARSAADAGLVRETRTLLEPGGLLGGERFVQQARYRQGEGGKIVRVDPEQRTARKRYRV
jgi:hypothetical protein